MDIKEIAEELKLRPFTLASWLIKLTDNPIDNNEFVRMTGLPKNNVRHLLTELSDFLEPPSQRVVVRKDKKNELRQEANQILEQLEVDSKWKEIKRVLKKYKPFRPEVKRELDQFRATDNTVCERAVEMSRQGDVLGRKIIFLGDNDLTSVAVSVLNTADKITVVDIDNRVLSIIEQISEEEELDIETHQQDLREELPEAFQGEHNVVFTDPPYTQNGVGTFLNRGIEAMRKSHDSRIYLCYGNSDRARERELVVQDEINKRGLLVHQKDFQFNSYYGAESIGSRSSLYQLDWTPKTRRVDPQGIRFYTNE